MTTLHVLDLADEKCMITGLVDIHYPCHKMCNGSFQQWSAVLLPKRDFKPGHRAASKVMAQHLLIVGKDAHTIATTRSKEPMHPGIVSDGDQHQWRIQ